MKINIKMYIFILCMLLFSFLQAVYGANVYSEVTAEIPVTFENKSKTDHELTAVIEAVDNAPMPDKSEIKLSASGEGSFKVRVDRPGKLTYRVYQKKGSNKRIEYDKRVYIAKVLVINSTEKDGELEYCISVSSDDGVKTKTARFVNRDSDSDSSQSGGGGGGKDGKHGTDDRTENKTEEKESSDVNTKIDKNTDDNEKENDDVKVENTSGLEDELKTGEETVGENNENNTYNNEENSEDKSTENTTATKAAVSYGEFENETVDTGDDNRQEIPIGLMIISAIVIVITIIGEKTDRKTKNN